LGASLAMLRAPRAGEILDEGSSRPVPQVFALDANWHSRWLFFGETSSKNGLWVGLPDWQQLGW